YKLTVEHIMDCRGTPVDQEHNTADFFLPQKIHVGDILITEILFNPRPGGADFVEIDNHSEEPLDLQELLIAGLVKDTIGNPKQLLNNSLMIYPGQYMALTVDPDNITSEYHVEDPADILWMASMPAFPDASGGVFLL